MAKRRLGQAAQRPTEPDSNETPNDEQQQQQQKRSLQLSDTHIQQRHPASIGKIHEIDLGRDTALRNKERTEMAIRRARGEDVPVEKAAVVKKPRLGRNGKPRRGPKARDVEDVKRDQLVEQVLHESRLEIYDDPESSNQASAAVKGGKARKEKETGKAKDGQRRQQQQQQQQQQQRQDEKQEQEQEETAAATAATPSASESSEDLGTDDRVAAQFRQEFMEAMQARHRHRAATGQAKQQARRARQAAAGIKPGDPQHQQQQSRGPKLGGSRSARAAMRALQQQEKAGTGTTGPGATGAGK